MNTGKVILIPFPFAELTDIKVRPAVVIAKTRDKYEDLILCAVSSIVPNQLSSAEMMLPPDSHNKLRVPSVIKIDRLITLKKESVIAELGALTAGQTDQFKAKFKQLVD
jgi:mRNA interferase MazF